MAEVERKVIPNRQVFVAEIIVRTMLSIIVMAPYIFAGYVLNHFINKYW